MKLPALASLLSLAAALAGASAGCKDDDPPGVYVEFRLEARAESEAFRPDQIDFHWMFAGQAEPTRHRLPRDGGAVSATDWLLYQVFIEAPVPLTERRLLTAVGLKGDTVVSGGVLVLEPDNQSIRRETLVMRMPLPDEDNDLIPDAIESNCLADDPMKCYPPGTAPPPPPDGGQPDEAPPVDAGPDAVDPDAGTETAPPVDVPPEAATNPLLVDLVGYWRMDDGTGSTTVRDWSGRNNTGTLVGNANTLWIPAGMGRWGGALNLPAGTGNGVIVMESPSLNGLQRAFTISAQTWRMAHRDNFATIASRRYMNGQNEFFNLHFLDGIARGIVNSHQPGGVAQGTVMASAQAPLGNWVHVAMTYDGSFLRLYQNGVQVSMAAYTATLAVTGVTNPLTLGCGQNGSNNMATDEALGGRLDDVLIWSRSLNADEIRRVSMGEHLM